jgi:hypothetical protein
MTVAVVVDSQGILNAFTLDTTTGASWQGPDIIGNASLLPGASLAIVSRIIGIPQMRSREFPTLVRGV